MHRCLIRQRHVQGYRVAFFKQRPQRFAACNILRPSACPSRIECHNRHAKSLSQSGLALSDCSQTDKTKYRAMKFGRYRICWLPLSLSDKSVMFRKLLAGGKQHGKDMFGDRECIATRSRKYGNTAFRGFDYVNVIVSCTVVGDDLQTRCCFEAIPVHLTDAHDHRDRMNIA